VLPHSTRSKTKSRVVETTKGELFVRRPKTLQAFTTEERDRVHKFLATRVAFMMGRKLEEGDWAHVYCSAKGIPNKGWSNLNIDVMYKNVGLEHKMLSRSTDTRLRDVCGTRLMHPAATRSIRVPSTNVDPNEAMRDVLTQYAAFLGERAQKVREAYPGEEPDMRIGWLLWKISLDEFLYFEEEVIAPNPDDYIAEWKETRGGGARKPSKNLWIYEKETGQKKYSITTSAGAKVQPYFDVPPPSDPNLHLFKVQGEELESGLVRVWITASTSRELRRLVGDLTAANLTLAIESVSEDPMHLGTDQGQQNEEAEPLSLATEAYELLIASFPGVSDEHMIQLLVQRLRQRGE